MLRCVGGPADASGSVPIEKAGAEGYTGAVDSSEDRYMTILVTGAAGFIGYHVCAALLDRGERVVGLDNLNDYYDPERHDQRVLCRVGKLAQVRKRWSVSHL